MLQVRPEDVVGTYNIFNDPNLTDPEKMAAVRRVFEEGKPTALLNTYTASNLAARTSVERATFHVSVSIFPLEDAQGQITHVVFQHIDLTELMVAEAAQRKIEQKYRALVESIPDPLVMLNYELDHVLVNEAAVQAAGMSRDQLMETNYLDMYPNRRDHPFYQAVTRVLETREQETVTAQWNFEDAGDRWAQLSIYPVPEGVLFFARDVSEYKAMEGRLLQFQTMEAIGTLAGGVAHDFNNLLTGVRGHAALMAMDLPDTHPGQEHCQDIEELVQSASALTQQLLGLARGGKYQAQPTDANEFLARTVTMFSRTRKQLMIRSTYAEDLWTVTVDRSQFEQVVLNLLVNAWQAMPSGGDLFVETKNRELDESFVAPFELKPGRYVQLSVTDAGVGMDDETLARVFEPFFTTREKGRGTGLGLASSYGIVRNHGGVIVASSERGKGSTFDVYVPATEASQVEDAGRDEGPSESGSETVLVIDDEDAVREITTQLLEHLGYRVFAASAGAAGIALFETSHDAIDLVILDMILPGEILAALRDVSDAVKVLLCSGYSLDGEANDLLAHGCQGFLQKPYPLATLADSVRKALDA